MDQTRQKITDELYTLNIFEVGADIWRAGGDCHLLCTLQHRRAISYLLLREWPLDLILHTHIRGACLHMHARMYACTHTHTVDNTRGKYHTAD